MKVREPVARPLDVIVAELVLTTSQAVLAGMLAYLAAGFWAERDAAAGPVVAILAAAAVGVTCTWLFWLLGGEGWPMALVDLPIAMVMGAALILGSQGLTFLGLDLPVVLLVLLASLYGVAAGFFLDSPRRWRWDQRRMPRQRAPVPRLSPATEAALSRIPRARPAPPAPSVVTTPATPAVPVSGVGATATRTAPSVRMATPMPAPARTEPTRRPQASYLGSGTPGPEGTRTETPETQSSPAEHDTLAPRSASAITPTQSPSAGPSGSPPRAADGSPAGSGIGLPTMEAPTVRRSPWAWASPPEWNRDDLDGEPRADTTGPAG